MATKSTPTGREYLRVSIKKARSLDDQHGDNQRAADERGITLVEPAYREAVSASRYATKARAEFYALLEDLATGAFGADFLVLWESNRGSRKVGEWVTLIDTCQEAGVRILVTTHGRVYDPGNARDRRSLLEDAVDAEYEVNKLSVGVRRGLASTAAAGRPHGRVPYGYQRVYDPVTRVLVTQEPHPDEAPVVRRMFELFVETSSLRGVEKALAKEGVLTRSGVPFSSPHIRAIIRRNTYVGDRVHRPGSNHRTPRGVGPATVTPGQWAPLVSRSLFLAAQQILDDPSRKKARPGRGIHWLSMIARCDKCGGPMGVSYRDNNAYYRCQATGCTTINQAEVDEVVRDVVLGYLARPDNHPELFAGEGDQSAELTQVRDDLAAIGAELDDLADRLGRGEISALLAARAEPGILARRAAAEARERALLTPLRLAGLIEPGPDIALRWKAAPMSARREVARMLLTPDVLGELRILPRADKRYKSPAIDRIRWNRVSTTEGH